ncbi:MAG: hypothetical protein ACOY0T_09885 [Myxococcota bacterium]
MAGFFRSGFAIRAVVCGLLCSGMPAACGLPDYRFEDQTPQGGAPGATRPRCATNADCATYSSTKTCDIADGHCVECLPSADSTVSSCGPGLYCDVNRCAVGCASNADCPDGLMCDPASHQCQGCTLDTDCPPGTACKAPNCVPNCADNTGCPTGFTCCNMVCAKLGSDSLHCGACSKACADRQDCINAACGEGSSCAEGFDDCDGKAGCEANLRKDRRNCGSCFVDCKDEYCNGGSCSKIDCPANRADCDDDETTGCEALLTSTKDCGFCGNTCSSFHGTPACVGEKCMISCDPNYKDCDGNPATGCEGDLQNDDANCGACGVVCSNPNGRTKCVEGQCVPLCNPGFGDCDGIAENGCETDLQSDVKNCGECKTSCVVEHATAACVEGVCSNVCEDGYEDCNGGTDGCEADLKSPASCGQCGVVCNDANGIASCSPAGECTLECKTGYADCVNGLEDGCETNTTNNVNNCGACGMKCVAPPQGSVTCVNSTCIETKCNAPLADCDGNGSCEVNVTDDNKNCGGCGIACTFNHGTGACVDQKCVLVSCEPGYADCTAAAGCETQLGTLQNCLKCGDSCVAQHGQIACTATGCASTCAIGWGDCTNPNDGCETQLNSNTNCGRCNGTCMRPNATTSCASGTCEVTGCNTNFGDCDREIPTPNGCETPLTSNTNCGACNKPCDIPNATESCATGSCVQGGCNTGFADCSAALAGCETPLGSNTNCSTCNDTCQPVHVTQNICTGTPPNSRCTPTCQPGYKSCDGDPSDGCETDINTPQNCGDCFAACSLPNANTYNCVSGSCQVLTCKTGFAHCNTSHTDGCELPVSSDINNCGGCGVRCSSNHGTPSCTGGACSTACTAGWGDCNTDRLDGCERDVTNDPNACGNCLTKCTAGAPFCVNSSCISHLTIGVGTPVNGSSTGGNNLTISHTLRAGPSANRVVVVAVASRGNGSAGRPTSVKYGNVLMNMKLEREALAVNQAWSGIYTLPNSALPAINTTSSVLITAGNSSNTYGMMASVVELTNVEQAAGFIDGLGGAPHGGCSGTLTDTITTATGGALIYGVVSFYGTGFTGASAASGQTIVYAPASFNQLGGIFGYVVAETPVSAFPFSWTPNACDTSAQSIVAFKPTVTP